MTLVVVEDPDADWYTAALALHFPGVRFAGVRSAEELLGRLGELGGTEVLITKGRAGLRADAAPVRPARSRRL